MKVKKKWQQRPLNARLQEQARLEGLHPLEVRILAGRLETWQAQRLMDLVQPSLKTLAPPQVLKDMDLAVARLVQAIEQQEVIGILTDYDVDGITSHALIYRSLNAFFGVPATRLLSLIGHRIEDGYGISARLTDRILNAPVRPSVIISADCGSSDEPTIARLKAAGIDVLVTDHHALPIEGPPSSAHAVINPTRADCPYPDKTLAGCAVAWLLMSALRQALIDQGRLAPTTPKLACFLDLVALGTVADCVSLGGSAMNRALVKTGVALMNRSDQPCWQAFRQLMGPRFTDFTPATLGFQLGPRINARSRMADPYAALHFLLAKDAASAMQQLVLLDEDNQQRREVERQMVEQALLMAQEQYEAGCAGLVVYLAEGHSGVQGIVASRLVERFGAPCVILTPSNQEGQLSGSARGVPGVHLRDSLQQVDDDYPGIFVRFGGHKGAAGFTLRQERLQDFQQAWHQALRQHLGEQALGPVLWTDGPLEPGLLNLATYDLLARLEPYGREFEAPVFEGTFRVESWRCVGADQRTVQLRLSVGEQVVPAIWFHAVQAGASPDLPLGGTLRCAFQLQPNHYRGQTELQLQLVDVQVES